MRSIQHQIIEHAEDALLQLVPGDTPVLVHEKRRAKSEQEEEKKEVDKEDRRKKNERMVWLRLRSCFSIIKKMLKKQVSTHDEQVATSMII